MKYLQSRRPSRPLRRARLPSARPVRTSSPDRRSKRQLPRPHTLPRATTKSFDKESSASRRRTVAGHLWRSAPAISRQRRIRDGDMSRARHTAIDRDRERWNLDVLVPKNRRRLEDRQHPAAARFTLATVQLFRNNRKDRGDRRATISLRFFAVSAVLSYPKLRHVDRRLGKTPDSADRVNCSKRFGCLLLLWTSAWATVERRSNS